MQNICIYLYMYISQLPLNLKYSSPSWKFVRIRVKSSSCLKIVQIRGEVLLAQFLRVVSFSCVAPPCHRGSEAILASTWVNSITKRLSRIAMWAEHQEKRSRPFQHNKWFILHPSHCLFVPALGSKPGCHWPAEPKHCLQKAKYHLAWAQARRPCSAVCKTYEKLLFNPTPCHRNA